ncbi:hypothetical protein RS030_6901 [Cryptosporidium xiaoi]|uniref:ribonuclease Z n=1 Tax=Cryptosporidium xiaoi TaxID=659607 RepID=A0AAV9XXE7_9CRYT
MFSELHFRLTGSGHLLSPRSLVLSYDGNRCLINAGENTQRYCFEHKVKLSKLRLILLTDISIETVGGLPGLLLTLSGIGVQRLRIIGPEPVLDYFLALGYRAGDAVISRDNGVSVKKCLLSVNSRDFLDVQRGGSLSSSAKFDLEIEVVELSLRGDNEVNCNESQMVRFELEDGVFLESYLVGLKRSGIYADESFLCKRRCTDKVISYSSESEFTHSSFTSKTKRPFVRDECSILYLFEFPNKKGKFDVSKAKSLGIPPGPLYSKLKDGENITLDSGKVVYSKEVCSPPIRLPWVMVSSSIGIFECQGIQDRIREIITLKGFEFVGNDEHVKGELKLDSVFYVFGFCSQSLFTREFDKMNLSYITNKDNSIGGQLNFVGLVSPISTISTHEANPFITSYFLQGFLSSIIPFVFPHKQFNIDPNCWNRTFSISHKGRAKYDYKSCMEKDNKECQFSASILKKMSKFSQESTSIDVISDKIKEYLNKMPLIKDEYPKLCVLGTGSAIPSPYRNVSGNLLRINNNTSMFLDCGEGSIFQMFVLFGYNKDAFFDIINTINFVFISHPHEDHFLGLFGLIKAKYFCEMITPKSELDIHKSKDNNNKMCSDSDFRPKFTNGIIKLSKNELERISVNNQIVIMGPKSIEKMLELHIDEIIPPRNAKLESEFDLKSKVIFIPIQNCNPNMQNKVALDSDTVIMFEPFPVKHIKHSFGIKVSLKKSDDYSLKCQADNQFTIVFSGDTVPCSSLELASKNCDVLIHEATFEDSLGEEARKKNHSTISEAVKTAVKCSAKSLLLTHFSQRYQSTPEITKEMHDDGEPQSTSKNSDCFKGYPEEEILKAYYNNNTLSLMDLMVIPLKSICELVKPLNLLNELIKNYLP